MRSRGTPVPAGSRIGRFRLRAFLGRGAFGDVFLAVDGGNGVEVALKVLSEAAGEESRAGIEREAAALRAVSHPGLPELVDHGEVDGRAFLALRFVPGRSLRERLGEGRLLPVEALAVAADLAEVLTHCHRRQLAHGDLKPENVILAAEGGARLIDLGHCEGAGLPPLAKGSGTPRYMAPEQWKGQGASPATDLFQLGAVLFEALSGRPPFPDTASRARALEDRAHPPAPPPGVSPPVAELLGALLAADPGERPERVVEVRGLLRSELALLPPPDPGQPGAALVVAPEAVAPAADPASDAGLEAFFQPVVAPQPVPLAPLVARWLAGGLVGLVVGSIAGRAVAKLVGPVLVAGGIVVVLSGWWRLNRARFLSVAPPAWALALATTALALSRPSRHGLWWGWLRMDLSLLFVAGGLLLVLAPILTVGLRIALDVGPRQLLEPEVRRAAARELLVPGLGHVHQGRLWRGVGMFAVAAVGLVTPPGPTGVLLLGASLVASWGSLVAHGLEQTRARRREEASMLADLQVASPAKVRCHKGMAVLTGRLVEAAREGRWALPVIERGRGWLKDEVSVKAAAEVRELDECFQAGRIFVLVTTGGPHLYCDRHDLCPSPLPRGLDRSAATGRVDPVATIGVAPTVGLGDES